MTRVYADYAAGAPLRPAAARALRSALASGAANASSVHREGARARALLESAREDVAAAIGARPLEVVFTSGATEANNLALGGLAAAMTTANDGTRPQRALRIAVPATEHSSVLRVVEALATVGHTILVLPVGPDGRAEPDAVRAARPDVLSVALVNAETGVVQPVAALAEAARASGACVHVDAAQAAAVLPVDVAAIGADLVTVSGHKVGGPPGTGALWVRDGVALRPLHHGGPQERGLRAGSENVPAIAAFAAAFRAARAAIPGETMRLGALATELVAGLRAIAADVIVAGGGASNRGGAAANRAPHVVDVVFPGVAGESLVAALDLDGVAASAGSACAAGASEPSHVLMAMGFGRADAASAVRFSFGWASGATDVARILAVLPGILARARARRTEAAWPALAS